eukprot:gnl/MRDRNA2_/MRDRNA2_87269_c0_seq1.p1 gnl/MRDRNA2_/MRDRNA2_87269_c0~~gnl/MRDRNA2_/MRDRNA2_87269_c0_seq1.p1  ORF type:complete len:210 (+),score=75.36 gnl/MRDRNA2_/MRDRNA2_87269_c0_seq1:114-743(+)
MVKEGCKWCEKGECWTHGQIEKPPGMKSKGKGKGGGKNPQAMMQMMMKMMGGGGGGMKDMQKMMAQAMGGGGKRKAGEITPEEVAPKNKLLIGLQLILTKNHQRNLTKDDTTWECNEVESDGKKYQVTVTISDAIGPEGGKAFTGEPSASKKDANTSAAQVAYDSMKEIFEPLEEEHKAKKKKKNQESLEALKKRTEEKKAAKAAEATA